MKFSISNILNILLKVFLFLLPWQTIWIYRESFLGGVKWEYGTLGFYATEILLWIIVVVFMIWYIKKFRVQSSKFKVRVTKDRVFLFSVLCLISYAIISAFWASDRDLAWQQGLRILEMFLLFFVLYLGPVDFKLTVKWLVLGAIIPSLLGIWQFLTQTTFASTLFGLAVHPAWQSGTSIIASETIGRWLRAYGPFSHPNVFGGYLVIVLWLSLRGGARATTKQSPGDLEKIKNINLLGIASSADANRLPRNDMFFYLTSYVLCLTCLFFTFSRSAWLALLIGLVVLCWRNLSQPGKACLPARQGWGLFLIMPVVLFSLLSFIFFPLLQTRTSNSTISETRSITERTTGYREAWQMIKQNPVLGVGAGNYTVALWRMDKWRPVWELQPVHNVLLLFIAELGFVGVGLFLLVILTFFSFQLTDSKYQLRCYLLSVICILPLLLFDHYLYSSYFGLMLSTVFFALFLKSDTQSLPS